MSSPVLQNGRQFIRYAKLILNNDTAGIDLSDMRFTFKIFNADEESPNTALIRVFNLSDKTVDLAIKEYTDVSVEAGYENGVKGTIFRGQIKRYRYGKESNVDSYLDIMAADGDLVYNFGVVNQTFSEDSSAADRVKAMLEGLNVQIDKNSLQVLNDMGGILPRGKTAFGMLRAQLAEVAESGNATWSIQGGIATFIPLNGFVPGTVIAINSQTGMVGQPEATMNGIEVTCLLNPLIRVGGRIQINNKDITKTVITASGYDGTYPYYGATDFFYARTTEDGIYKVLVAEHEGDTWGNAWYTTVTCLDVDQTKQAVNPNG